jgi:glutamate/tyrosine decarboxylase-like PLP-dependent enzyme
MTSHDRQTLMSAAQKAVEFASSIDSRQIAPSERAISDLRQFDEKLPDVGRDQLETVEMLSHVGSPATMANTGRYFGHLNGGSLPAAMAANWIATAWDQNAGLTSTNHVNAAIERVTESWLTEILPVAKGSAVGFVSGVTMANFCALAAARSAILARHDWDVETRGLSGAPQIKVVVGAEVHGSVLKALRLLGLGTDHIIRIPTDDNGRMRSDRLPVINSNTIVILQAGNISTGVMDSGRLVLEARKYGAWVHIDGAFGLWAGASSQKWHLTRGYEFADSWSTNAHKWLNVPNDSGMVICRNRERLQKALSVSGDYFHESEDRIPYKYFPELSRRARAIDIWATLRTLGRSGIDNLITRTCGFANRFAELLADAGYEILNKVETNQVLVSFGSDEETLAVIREVQREGTCWASSTVWRGKLVMQLSVSSWKTTEEDIDRSVDAIIRSAQRVIQKAA